jgi:hypothetical protein
MIEDGHYVIRTDADWDIVARRAIDLPGEWARLIESVEGSSAAAVALLRVVAAHAEDLARHTWVDCVPCCVSLAVDSAVERLNRDGLLDRHIHLAEAASEAAEAADSGAGSQA